MVNLFQNHLVRSSTDRSWIICAHTGGEWQPNSWIEISSLEGGLLYVGSQTEHCIFGRYKECRDHRKKVAWIGGQSFGPIIKGYAEQGGSQNPPVVHAYWAVHKLHSLLPTNMGDHKTVQMRLSPKTLANIADIGRLTGAATHADSIAYSVELARLITQEARSGKTLYFEANGVRDRLDLAVV